MPLETASYPDNNPKTSIGVFKAPLHAIPPVALIHLGLAMEDGEKKYGLTNWRKKTVSSSVYYDAMLRHLLAWWDGEDAAPDSQVHHLGHVMACAAILLDAEQQTQLNDDRPEIEGGVSVLMEQIRRNRSIVPHPDPDLKELLELSVGEGLRQRGPRQAYRPDPPRIEGEDFATWKEIDLRTGTIDPHPIDHARPRPGIRKVGQ